MVLTNIKTNKRGINQMEKSERCMSSQGVLFGFFHSNKQTMQGLETMDNMYRT